MLGVHPSHELQLDLATPAGRARWLAAARLLSARDAEPRALDAFRALDAAGLAAPDALAGAGPERVAAALRAAGLARPEPVGGRAVSRRRVARRELRRRSRGVGLGQPRPRGARRPARRSRAGPRRRDALALPAPAARRLERGARGAAGRAARAAAVHLGLLRAGEDLEGEPATLRAALARHAPELALADVEAALERLGARACRAGRLERCPLGDRCPARAQGGQARSARHRREPCVGRDQAHDPQAAPATSSRTSAPARCSATRAARPSPRASSRPSPSSR